MGVAKLDENSRPTLTAVSNTDGSTVVPIYADPITHRLLVDSTTTTNATNAEKVAVTDDTTSNAIFLPTFVILPTGNRGIRVSSTKLTFEPLTGDFTSTNFIGTFAGNTFTTGTGTLTIAASKTFVVNKSITLDGTDSTTMTFPSTSATVARTDAAQTFTGTQTFTNALINTNNAITAVGNAATVPVTAKINTVTNNSAATLTITMTTTSAVNRQLTEVLILDASGVAQTITWVNTENSSVSAPTTSNGSTTLPLTVLFQYNSATTKWRCIAVC